jgi:hypothetical protein
MGMETIRVLQQQQQPQRRRLRTTTVRARNANMNRRRITTIIVRLVAAANILDKVKYPSKMRIERDDGMFLLFGSRWEKILYYFCFVSLTLKLDK